MNIRKNLLEGLKLAALLGAIALVVWSMPEYEGHYAQASGQHDPALNR
jgi:hypothetical protein